MSLKNSFLRVKKGAKMLYSLLNQKVKKLSFLDLKLAQLVAVFGALIIVKLFPQILNIPLGWFITLLIASAIKPLYSFWIKK
jgi:hypothetical protein